jgi:hypothetical protein
MCTAAPDLDFCTVTWRSTTVRTVSPWRLPTHTWWVRIFMSVLGIATTNAYLLYKAAHKKHGASTEMSFHQFINQVASSLCDIGRSVARPGPAGRRRHPVAAEERENFGGLLAEFNCVCEFRPLEEAPD